jgi:death on curing protein
MKTPVWVLREAVLALHEQALVEFGGEAGIRDEGLLDSAMANPQNLFAYGKPDLFELAANYGFGLVKNHPFVDGNKRIGFIVAVVFLELNGYIFQATEAEAAVRTFELAAGKTSEAEYAEWLKANSRRV